MVIENGSQMNNQYVYANFAKSYITTYITLVVYNLGYWFLANLQ